MPATKKVSDPVLTNGGNSDGNKRLAENDDCEESVSLGEMAGDDWVLVTLGRERAGHIDDHCRNPEPDSNVLGDEPSNQDKNRTCHHFGCIGQEPGHLVGAPDEGEVEDGPKAHYAEVRQGEDCPVFAKRSLNGRRKDERGRGGHE